VVTICFYLLVATLYVNFHIENCVVLNISYIYDLKVFFLELSKWDNELVWDENGLK
jgi:hypothetical protein